jgi:hypothetical protein
MDAKTNETVMDAAYFITILEPIPNEKWCTNTYSNGCGQHCTVGHVLNHAQEWDSHTTPQVDALRDLIHTHLETNAMRISDGLDIRHQQETPRARILAALRDIQSKEAK